MVRAKSFNLPSNAIICVAGDYCNLRCSYCFHHERNQKSKQMMSEKLLGKFIREFLNLPLPIFIFNWHGGEPLLAGLPFFKKVIRLQRQFCKKGQLIQNLIQTNGTLINERWALFFKRHNFGVGVSLDGEKENHNRFRVDSNSQGSFKKVVKGIRILQRYGIKPGILQTLTHDNISRTKTGENFLFFINKLGIRSLAVNPFFGSSRVNKKLLNQSISNREFTAVLKDYIDFWLAEDNKNLQIREIDNFLGGILKKPIHHCDFNGLCWTTFCLNYNGKIYFCDRFLNQEKFLCGDFSKQSLLEIFTSSVWRNMVKKAKTLPSECKSCQWQVICHNGCSYLRVGGIRGKYYYCPTRKNVFSYLEKLIKKYPIKKGDENYER